MTIVIFFGKNVFLSSEIYFVDKIWLLLMQEYLAPEIISHFVMHGTSVAEIVKHLITVLKKKDDDLAAIFLEALKRVIAVLDAGFSLYVHIYMVDQVGFSFVFLNYEGTISGNKQSTILVTCPI